MSMPEDVLEKVLTGELTRQEAIRQHPDMEDRLLLLTGLADELRALPRYQPDADFRNRARLRLLQHIETTRQRRRWWPGLPGPPFDLQGWAARGTAVAAAVGVLTLGAGYASTSALPDNALYPVKRAVERVQVRLATSDEARADTYLSLADRRAAEISATAPALDDAELQNLARDYSDSLAKVSQVVQAMPAPAPALLDKVQTHIASQATEIEARAVNASSRPAVQQQLVQAEVVASTVVDHVTLIAEKTARPGAQDVHLAANAQAAATAAAVTALDATPAGQPESAPPPAATPAPAKPPAGVLGPAPTPDPTAAPASAAPAASAAGSGALDGQFDRLWNHVAAAPFMGKNVRTQLEVDVANAKQHVHAGRPDAASAALTGFISQLNAAVAAHQATQYTATHLVAEARAILAGLPPAGPAR